MCGVRCILRTGVVKVRSTCNKEIGSRLLWGSYVHKRERRLQIVAGVQMLLASSGESAVGEFGRECCQ